MESTYEEMVKLGMVFVIFCYIHPASRGMAAHTAAFFRSVTGAKQLTYITVGFFNICACYLHLYFKKPQPSAAWAVQGHDFPPPLGILPMGAFLSFPPREIFAWGPPKLGNFK